MPTDTVERRRRLFFGGGGMGGQRSLWAVYSPGDHAQNLPRPYPDNVTGVFQISFKSVHFRLSYTQTREHRQSVSNIRLKLSFERNNSGQFVLAFSFKVMPGLARFLYTLYYVMREREREDKPLTERLIG